MTSARTGAEVVEVLLFGVLVNARTGAEAVEVLVQTAGVEPTTTRTGITMFRR